MMAGYSVVPIVWPSFGSPNCGWRTTCRKTNDWKTNDLLMSDLLMSDPMNRSSVLKMIDYLTADCLSRWTHGLCWGSNDSSGLACSPDDYCWNCVTFLSPSGSAETRRIVRPNSSRCVTNLGGSWQIGWIATA